MAPTEYGYLGRWRTARKTHNCEYKPHGPSICNAAIPAGTRYYDTGEYSDRAGGWATERICPNCAKKLGYEEPKK